MTRMPQFQYRTKIKGTTFSVPRVQMRILWHLSRGARVETWCTAIPVGRLWTKDGAEPISPRSVSALWEKKLVKRSTKIIEKNRKIRTRWDISSKGSKIIAAYS